jgi:hypothetical protein
VSYNSIAAAAQDADLKQRVAACFAQETDGPDQPEALAALHMWRIVANGPIADAYSYAVATDVPDPGSNEAVVTDAAILDAVTAIVAPAPVQE